MYITRSFLVAGLSTLFVCTAKGSAAIPYVDPSQIGTLALTGLNSTNPANAAIITRQEDEVLPNRTTQVRHGSRMRHILPGAPLNFSAEVNGSLVSIDTFMYDMGLGGLMVVKDGSIRLEKYDHSNQKQSRNSIQSCTKSITSTAFGIAVKQGKIHSHDLAERWIPELKGTPYGDVTLRSIMDMTAGVAAPMNATDYFTVYEDLNRNAVLDLFKTYERVAAPDTVYNYMDQNYAVTAIALQRAISEPIENFVTRHIWDPAGMQYDGYMRTTAAHQVDGHGGLAITLADMARFGLFILDNLQGRGGPAVPSGWFEGIAAANTSRGIRAPGNIIDVPGFGYQTGWWTLPRGSNTTYALGDDEAFAALGMYGQAIYVIPRLNTTVVLQSYFPIQYGELFYYGQEFVTALALALKA
ncbi:beta-lactamase/transpeptidase-like protein [Aureobasidium pullulans]|nr:beta-lactamase/transpeptidase-like protein [Aureobasidium pullulans]